MVILETRDLKKQYGTGETAVHALAGVNLSVENGEFVAVVGTSGSGKSTLLHMLGGLDRATSGKVYVDGIYRGDCRGTRTERKIKRAAKPAFGRTAAARGDRAGTRSQTGDFISR